METLQISEQSEITKLLKQIAEKYNISLQEARQIYRIQFFVVSNNIRNTNVDNTDTHDYAVLPKYGVFSIDKTKIKKHDKRKKNIHSEPVGKDL